MAARKNHSRFIIGSLAAAALGLTLGVLVLAALIYLVPGGETQSKTNDNRIVSASPVPTASETPAIGQLEAKETPEASPAAENTPRETTPAVERTPQTSVTPRINLTPKRTPPVVAADTPRSAPPRSTPRVGSPVSIPTVHP